MAKLAKNVYVRGHGWYGPAYPDAGDPPAGSITNPQCWEGGSSSSSPPGESTSTGPVTSAPSSSPSAEPTLNPPASGGPPPKSGRGSSDENWTAYARRNGVSVGDDMSRREVIAACQAAGVPT